LKQKLSTRDANRYRELADIRDPEPHPVFHIVEGDIEDWELVAGRR
jgi:hypothetical protein